MRPIMFVAGLWTLAIVPTAPLKGQGRNTVEGLRITLTGRDVFPPVPTDRVSEFRYAVPAPPVRAPGTDSGRSAVNRGAWIGGTIGLIAGATGGYMLAASGGGCRGGSDPSCHGYGLQIGTIVVVSAIGTGIGAAVGAGIGKLVRAVRP